MQVEIGLILALNYVWHLLNFLNLINFFFCLQLLRDVEMEPLGRRSGDSFRSISSPHSQSCKRSCKKQLDRKTTKTHKAEKVRKHWRKSVKVWIRKLTMLSFIHLRLASTCPHVVKHHTSMIWRWFSHVCVSFLTLPASVCHEWTIKDLRSRAGFQFSDHRRSPPPSSYQEAQPQSDQCDFRCLWRERKNLR